MNIAQRPSFLITVDTEGDNLWSRPRTITTYNARFLPQFQRLCETYALRPTYLVNYEMGCDPAFQEFARDIVRRDAGEIGMHLHAWNTPPMVSATPDDFRYQPYLTEYPHDLIREKIQVMTDLLAQQIGVRAVSHRAGRWGMNNVYARALLEHGYLVDCSVTPLVSWRDHTGDPRGRGGPDYRAFPREPYFVDLDNVARPGKSCLLEIPMTIVSSRPTRLPGLRRLVERLPRGRRVLERILPAAQWLRPNGRNGSVLLQIAHRAQREGWHHLQMMVHSSELMPGGSPRFRTLRDVQVLYRDLERLFELARSTCSAATLGEFANAWARARRPQAVGAGNVRA